ncbi:MAG: LacI family DNA-binding transcriptional regulator [Verrucomicrobiota bacterium]
MTQVAELAGVSQATVSRVVEGSPKVSEATRLKVERAMKEIGYVPSPPRRRRRRSRKQDGLSGSKVKLIAVLVTEHSLERHPGFVLKMFRGAREAAEREGISVWLGNIRDEKDVTAMVKAVDADGVLLAGVESLPGISRQSIGRPVVWLTSHADAGADAILPGNEAAGKMAADYLLGRDHQTLAFLNVDDLNPSYQARGEAFVRSAKAGACKIHQVTFTGDCSVDEEQSLPQLDERVKEAVEKLLAAKPRATGLFVPSDLMTALVYRELNRCGVKPGKDIDIISCDNEEAYLTGLSPRPATIDIAGEERGRRAVYELLVQSRFPEEQRPVQLTVEPQLVVRE